MASAQKLSSMVWRAYLLLVFLSLVCLSGPGIARESFPPEQLMLLVIARSSVQSDKAQQRLLDLVRQLRLQPGMEQVQLGTMHFDRPREAEFARKVLNVQLSQLPCVALVELDPGRREPVRSLESWSHWNAGLEPLTQAWTAWTQEVASAPPIPAPALATPTPQLPAARDRVLAGVNLVPNQWLRSPNGRFGCCFQEDGNLVIYQLALGPPQTQLLPLWSSQTQRQGAVRLRLGSDGVLRLYSPTGDILWQVGEGDFFAHCYLQMQDDGNLVLYRQAGDNLMVSWASHTSAMH